VRVVAMTLRCWMTSPASLQRLGCEVEKAVDSLDVSIPFVPEESAERVLGVFLRNWRGGVASIRSWAPFSSRKREARSAASPGLSPLTA
jgi:hypothetical protein